MNPSAASFRCAASRPVTGADGGWGAGCEAGTFGVSRYFSVMGREVTMPGNIPAP